MCALRIENSLFRWYSNWHGNSDADRSTVSDSLMAMEILSEFKQPRVYSECASALFGVLEIGVSKEILSTMLV